MTTTLLAFDAQAIVEAHAGALRSRAILPPVMCLTRAGILYVHDANDIRSTPGVVTDPASAVDEPYGAIYVNGQWIALTEDCIRMWARQEGLNWRKPDGTIVLWNEIQCENCGGTGSVISYQDGQPLACWFCRGAGKLIG